MKQNNKILALSNYSGILIFIGVVGAIAMLAELVFEMNIIELKFNKNTKILTDVLEWGSLAFAIAETLFISMIAITLQRDQDKRPATWHLWVYVGLSIVTALCTCLENNSLDDDIMVSDILAMLYLMTMIAVAISFITNKKTRNIGLSMLLFWGVMIVVVCLYDQGIVTSREKTLNKIIGFCCLSAAYFYFKQCAKFLKPDTHSTSQQTTAE